MQAEAINDKDDLSNLINKAARKLISLTCSKDVYKFIADSLKEILPDSIIIVNKATDNGEYLEVVEIRGIEEDLIIQALSITGSDLFQRRYKVSDTFRQLYTKTELYHHTGGLSEFASSALPDTISVALKSHFKIHDIFTIGIADNAQYYGSVHLFTTSDKCTINKPVINTFIYLCFLCLDRIISHQLKLKSDHKYELLFKRMISGLAVFKVVTDCIGTPVDYIFKDVNTNFEKMFELEREDILGRKLSEVLPDVLEDSGKWLKKLGKIATDGGTLQMVFYFPMFDKWFSVHAYSPQLGFCAIILENITERKTAEKDYHQLELKLKCLSDINHFRSSPVSDLINYGLIKASELTGSKIAYIYKYDAHSRCVKMVSFSGSTVTYPAQASKEVNIDTTGMWGEAARLKGPIFIDDFDLPEPLREIFPGQQENVSHLLNIPLFTEGEVTAIAGVAEKEQKYEEVDALFLSLLMDSVWTKFPGKQTQA